MGMIEFLQTKEEQHRENFTREMRHGHLKRRKRIMNILIGIIGATAVLLLIYYIYILMKGDEQ